MFVRLEEINHRLRNDDFSDYLPSELTATERNLKKDLLHRKYEKERNELIDKVIKAHPDFSSSLNTSGERKLRCHEKVYIPAKEHPEINFIGLLIGPRGSTLKDLESSTGAKVSIRGRGSHKDGKAKITDYEDDDDDLHCYVSAETEDKVLKAVRRINEIVEAVSFWLIA